MTNTTTGQQIIKLFEEWVPKSLAMEGDKVGLQVGSLNKPIHKVMVTLDVLENVVDEAIEKNVDLIIAHHPFIYRPLNQVNPDTEKGRILEKLIMNKIAVYVAHTNLDLVNDGVNDMLMRALDIKNTDILIEMGSETLYKLVIFVPKTHEEDLRNVIGNSGAGHIGNYSHCFFGTDGKGSFKPLEGTNPYIGKQGEIEYVDEIRLETIVPKHLLPSVLKAMNDAHPYEEVAYDLYTVSTKGEPYGLGRIGKLESPLTLKDFAEHVKKAFNVPALRVVGDLDKKVRTIGVIGGDGNKYISQAKRRGCDVFITGDLYFHTAHDALGMGLNVIDPGHHVEKVMKKGVKEYLEKCCIDQQIPVEIITSEAKTEPFQFI